MKRIYLQRPLLLALILFCVIALPSLAMASSYYVAPNGNDSYNGLFPSYQNGFDGPFRTVNRAAGAARAGDTVFIRGGTYHETVNFSASGTSANRITITSYESEKAIIDGEYTLPTGSVYYYLCTVSGDYVTLSNITIKRSAGSLFVLSGDYDRAINVTGIGSRESGMVAGGNYNVFDGCTMTDNGNGYGIGGQGTWGSAICTVGSNTTIQNCTSFENKGEGINAYSRSSNSIIQDNIIYDNRSYNLYLDSSNGSIVRRNIVYQTKVGYAQYGITIGAETGQPSSILVCNNLVVGCFVNFHIDSNVANLANAKVIYNTFVNSTGYASEGYNMGVYFRPDTNTYSNSVFTNNIVLEEMPGRVPVFIESAHPGLTFSNNCWSRNPVAAAVGVGDVLGDPKLSKSGLAGPGSLTSAWFKIQENSPVRYQAQSMSEVAEDFFRPERWNPGHGCHRSDWYDFAVDSLLGRLPGNGPGSSFREFRGKRQRRDLSLYLPVDLR